MVRVIVGTTTQKSEKNYPSDTTIRHILEDNAIDYSTSQIMLDGASLKTEHMDSTLAQLNKKEKCMLIAVVKAANANA